jgi:hypothetical protein
VSEVGRPGGGGGVRGEFAAVLRRAGDGRQMDGDRRMRSLLVRHMRVEDATSGCCKNSSGHTEGERGNFFWTRQ